MNPQVRTIFFDFDGTLHETGRIYLPAFRKAYQALTEKGLAPPRTFSDKEIQHWLGHNAKDMWEEFMPQLPGEEKLQASEQIRREMLWLLKKGQGRLYPGVKETLRTLRLRGIHLVFFSNCRGSYRDAVREIYGLDEFFHDYIISESYDFQPKHAILKQVMDQYQREILVVGDRIHDVDAGFRNGLSSVACRYGYGTPQEFVHATGVIDHMEELIPFLENI